MLIRDTTWNRIRENFSEDEKALLRERVTGETICPRGFVIDESKLEIALREKIKAALAPRQPGEEEPK